MTTFCASHWCQRVRHATLPTLRRSLLRSAGVLSMLRAVRTALLTDAPCAIRRCISCTRVTPVPCIGGGRLGCVRRARARIFAPRCAGCWPVCPASRRPRQRATRSELMEPCWFECRDPSGLRRGYPRRTSGAERCSSVLRPLRAGLAYWLVGSACLHGKRPSDLAY